MKHYIVKVFLQGSLITVVEMIASNALEAINQIENKVNPVRNSGNREYFFCYEARAHTTFELS